MPAPPVREEARGREVRREEDEALARRLQEEDEALARRLQEEDEALARRLQEEDETASYETAGSRPDARRVEREEQDREYEAMEREDKRRRVEEEARAAEREAAERDREEMAKARAEALQQAGERLGAWSVVEPLRVRAAMPWGMETVPLCRTHGRGDVMAWFRDKLLVHRGGDGAFRFRVQLRGGAGLAEDWEGRDAADLDQCTLMVTYA